MKKSIHRRAVGILCGDFHLSLKAPVARSAEENWLDAQTRPLDQLKDLSVKYDCDIFCTGDIFDKWDSKVELVNWAMEYLPPRMWSIAGNHDLPLHSYDDIKKSAYWTLARSRKIKHLANGVLGCKVFNWNVFGFNFTPSGCTGDYAGAKNENNLALVHEYCYGSKKSAYKDAPKSANAANLAERFKNFQVLASGDNHTPFEWMPAPGKRLPRIYNAGGLQRRTISEIDHEPIVNVLFEDGHVEPHFLDCSEDKFIDVDAACEIVEKAMDMTDFLNELKALGEKGLDFAAAVKRFVSDNNVQSGVAKKIFKALES